jgi:hypothetical protein
VLLMAPYSRAICHRMWQRTESVRRVRVTPLTRRCQARAGSPNSLARRRTSFVVALALLACGEQLCSAQSIPAAPDRAGASAALRTAPIQDPRVLEQALLAEDPAEATRLFWRFSCSNYSNSESAEVVRRAWELRDSSGATRALKDPVVRTLMAKCLAETWPRFRPLEPGDAPVMAQLRLAIGSDNPEEVRAAASGLTQTATAEDVQSIVAAAVRIQAVAVLLSSNLWQICRVDAIEGARSVTASVMDARQRASMEANEEHLVAMQRLLCEFDANIVGSGVSQADIDDFWVPGRSGPRPSANDIRNALQSTNVYEAREMLWRLRCLPSEKDSLELISAAWRTRNSSAPESVTRDLDVRVVMAVCLAEADAASNMAVDASMVEVLRHAIGSSDPRNFVAGVEGLSRNATGADVRLIENAVKGRSSVFSTIAVGNLTRSCAPGAGRAAQAIREHTSSPQGLRAIEYEIWSTQRLREFVCAARKGGGK